MTAVTYKALALDWQPQQRAEKRFRLLLAAAVTAMLVLGAALSMIETPEKDRFEKAKVPDRVARFVTERKPVAPPKPKPKPEPIVPPPPVVEQPPRVERERPKEAHKPLTEEQKKARDVAEKSGLLALREEMSGLMTAGAQARNAVAGELKGDAGTDVVAGHDANVITAGTAGGSGGVDGSKYTVTSGTTNLSGRELTAALDQLAVADAALEEEAKESIKDRERPPGGRSRESVTMVLDQHKGMFYSLYERERRRTLGLQGIVVIELTIQPDGSVSDARIVSSELNSPGLEQRLIARIKTLAFGTLDSPPLTVTFPIEFLPS